MKHERPSVTAAWVAAARTCGGMLPPAYRLADDPYGAALAGTRVAERLKDTRLGRALAMRRGVGSFIAYLQVRTRGWQADEVAPYLATRGWNVIENRSLDDAAYDLWPAELARNMQARGSRYALAEVA